eukprot:Skav205270  [mRNA]  locus=scaffold1841:177416:177658:+ [translate_table: standard]
MISSAPSGVRIKFARATRFIRFVKRGFAFASTFATDALSNVGSSRPGGGRALDTEPPSTGTAGTAGTVGAGGTDIGSGSA